MGILTLEVFTSVIESIRLQLEKDRLNAAAIGEIYNTDSINPYDNSLLIKSLVSLLHVHFPKTDDHCEIEHYMFDLNFGKSAEFFIPIEELWDRLTPNHPNKLDAVISWNNTEPTAFEGRAPFKNILFDEVGHWDQSHWNKVALKKESLISTHPLIDEAGQTISAVIPSKLLKEASKKELLEYIEKRNKSNT